MKATKRWKAIMNFLSKNVAANDMKSAAVLSSYSVSRFKACLEAGGGAAKRVREMAFTLKKETSSRAERSSRRRWLGN